MRVVQRAFVPSARPAGLDLVLETTDAAGVVRIGGSALSAAGRTVRADALREAIDALCPDDDHGDEEVDHGALLAYWVGAYRALVDAVHELAGTEIVQALPEHLTERIRGILRDAPPFMDPPDPDVVRRAAEAAERDEGA